MNDDQSMRDLVAGGHSPRDQAAESRQPGSSPPEAGPEADGRDPAAVSQGAQAPQTPQDQAGQVQSGQDQPGQDQPGQDQPKASGEGEAQEAAGQRKRRPFWRELVILVVLAMVIALLIKTFVVQAFFIPSSSMENTLLIGDKVLVNKVVYHLRPIRAGDIVVFNGEGSWDPVSHPKTSSNPIVRVYDDTLGPLFRSIGGLFGTAPGQTDFIKRVIGVPGDHVRCCNAFGQVTVNGVALHERSYLYPGASPSQIHFNITVPKGRLWVMGDNRQISDDSRLHTSDPGGGTVPENKVIGRAFMIVWPPSRWRVLQIPDTFSQPGITAAANAAAGAIPVTAGAAAPYLPLAGGFAAALPLTWLQLRVRRRLGRRGRGGGGGRAQGRR
jgi:signal peptidase I